MVMTSKDTRKLMNITKRVLTEQVTPNFPMTLAGSMNKKYGIGLKEKYSHDELVKLITETYISWSMVTSGLDREEAKKRATKTILRDVDFVRDTISALK